MAKGPMVSAKSDPAREAKANQIRNALDGLYGAVSSLRDLRYSLSEESPNKTEEVAPGLSTVAVILAGSAGEINSMTKNIHSEIEELKAILF